VVEKSIEATTRAAGEAKSHAPREIFRAGPVEFDALGMRAGEPSEQAWAKLGGELGRGIGAEWLKGDMLAAEEKIYGEMAERYRRAAALLGWSPENKKRGCSPRTLQNDKSLSVAFPRERRHFELTRSHYELVRNLDPAEQDRRLAEAVENGWGRDEFRKKLREASEGADDRGDGDFDDAEGDDPPAEIAEFTIPCVRVFVRDGEEADGVFERVVGRWNKDPDVAGDLEWAPVDEAELAPCA
jgi:hypothetical protein